MSYDLMAFDPEAAPRNYREFLEWYMNEMEAEDGICFVDPAITTEPLRSWFMEITQRFPSLNWRSPMEELPEDEATACD